MSPVSASAVVALLALALGGCVNTRAVERDIDGARVGPVRVGETAPDRNATSLYPQGDANAADDRELHGELIRGMIDQGQYYAAVAHVEAQRVRQGDSVALRWLEADARRRLGELAEAERLLDSLRRGPYAAQAEHGLGLIAAQRGQPAAALDHLQRAVSLAPTDAGMRNDLGYAYLQQRRFEAALTQLATASELAPNDARVRNNLVLLLLASGDARRALEVAETSGLDTDGFVRLQQQAQTLRGQIRQGATP